MDVASLHSPRNGDLTLAEKTLTPLTDAYIYMIEIERALCTSKGIHRAGGWDVVPEHLAKLLRHHWLRCCDADGIDVRGDFLDCGVSGASIAGECGDCNIQHANSRAFWR